MASASNASSASAAPGPKVWAVKYVGQKGGESIAVFGDTKAFREELAAAGGAFNGALKTDKGPSPGWIFSSKKREAVDAVVEKINAGNAAVSSAEVKRHPKSAKPSRDEDGEDLASIVRELSKRVKKLEKRLAALEAATDSDSE